jgi:hypothetical protein
VAAARYEAALPEADLIALDGQDEDEEKEASVLGVPAAPALGVVAALATGGPMQLRLLIDAAQLSPRAREALAVLAEEGVALSARISFEGGER